MGGDVGDGPGEREWQITRGLRGGAPVYRFLPGVSRGEGLFLAVLHKHGESEGCLSATGGADRKAEKPKKEKRRGNKGAKAGFKQPSNVAVPLNAPESYVVRRRTDALFAVPVRSVVVAP